MTLTASGALARAGTFSRTDRFDQDVDLTTARINCRLGGQLVAKH
ncbi:hypothetical protein [Bradyrhizobium sp. RDT46]